MLLLPEFSYHQMLLKYFGIYLCFILISLSNVSIFLKMATFLFSACLTAIFVTIAIKIKLITNFTLSMRRNWWKTTFIFGLKVVCERGSKKALNARSSLLSYTIWVWDTQFGMWIYYYISVIFPFVPNVPVGCSIYSLLNYTISQATTSTSHSLRRSVTLIRMN